jgi:4-amino-4-deoxy-L-arabinose transferase-like glycosyltransferase
VCGWSVILPEALCTIGSVAVLYAVVKRSFGETCGLLAALFMALTPIVAAVSRTNNLMRRSSSCACWRSGRFWRRPKRAA